MTQHAKPEILGVIALHDGDKVVSYHPVFGDKLLWGDYVQAYGSKELEGFKHPIVMVPESNAVKKKGQPLACLFTATQDLTKNSLGPVLDLDDHDFFDEHPLATEQGVSLANTLRVVQEVIDPYGLRVSRVYIMPGTPLFGDLAQWPAVLGCNPIGMGDLSTSNEEFAKLTGMSLDEANKLYRLEYTTKLLRPSICCAHKAFDANSKTGENLGHAKYIGPRAKMFGEEATLQVQLGRKEDVPWRKEPVFPPVPPAQERELNLYQTRGPDGLPMGGWYHRHPTPVVGGQGATSDGSHADGSWWERQRRDSKRANPSAGLFECFICGGHEPKDNRIGMNLCMRCWKAMWNEYRCTNTRSEGQGYCGVNLKDATLRSMFTETEEQGDGSKKVKSWRLQVQCPKCHQPCNLTVDRSMKGEYAVISAIRGIRLTEE